MSLRPHKVVRLDGLKDPLQSALNSEFDRLINWIGIIWCSVIEAGVKQICSDQKCESYKRSGDKANDYLIHDGQLCPGI